MSKDKKRERLGSALTVVAVLLAGSVSWRTEIATKLLDVLFQISPTAPAIDSVTYDDARPTVLVFVRSSCQFCSESMPLYRQLETAAQRSGRFRMVFVDDEGKGVGQDYLARNQIRADSVVSSPYPTQVSLTPTVFLVNAAHRIVGKWIGALRPDGERNLINRVGVSESEWREAGETIRSADLATAHASLLAQVQTISGTLALAPEEVAWVHEGDAVIVEFTDFECPLCGRYAREVSFDLRSTSSKRYNLRYLVRNFPIERTHEHAMDAAVIAQCAATVGKYWPVHNAIFQHQTALTMPELRKYAIGAGVGTKQLDSCLRGSIRHNVIQQISDGKKIGVHATPTFVFGIRRQDKIRLEHLLVGYRPFREMEEIVDSLVLPLKSQHLSQSRESTE